MALYDDSDEEIEDIDLDEFADELVDKVEGIDYDELADTLDEYYANELDHSDIVEQLMEEFDISKDGAERAIRIYNANIDGEF